MSTIKKFVFNIPNEKAVIPTISKEEQRKQLEEVNRKLLGADVVIVGIGSGMSSAGGYNYYHETAFFNQYFNKYKERYGFNNLFFGLNHVYASPEEQWAFLSEYVYRIESERAADAYLHLNTWLKSKNYFIITTNIDAQVSKVFPKEKIWTFQGDVRYFQCSQPCHDAIYSNRESIHAMIKTIHDYKVDSNLIPRCPYCGRRMCLWVRDEQFLEGTYWNEQRQQYEQFVETYKNERVLFLELGVGDMTPSIIKFPFWEMTYNLPNAYLVSINIGDRDRPQHLLEKTTLLTMDLNEALRELCEINH